MKKTLKVLLSILLATIFVMGITPLTVSAARSNATKVKSQTTSQRLVITEKAQYSFYVRTKPTTTSTSIGKISNNDFPIEVLETAEDSQNRTWYKFKYGKENGWVISSRVIKVEEVSASKNTTSTTKKTSTTKASTTTTTRANTTSNQKKVSKAKYIQANGVTNVRQKHELGRNVIAKWHQSDTPLGLKVLEEKIVGKMLWYKVFFNGKYGWCQSVAVTVISPTSTTNTSTTTTTSTTATTRTTTATKAKTTSTTPATTTAAKAKTTKKTTTTKTPEYGKKVFFSSYSTNYGSSDKGRKQNIKVTCDYLDGITIKPGEEFNWFTMMPTTTKAHGYTLAGVFQNGKTVQGMGGGLCQVTSTLYNVCLDLEEKELVKITARQPHGLRVTYVPPGRDATISRASGINYCFTDTSNCILVISATANGQKCTVSITGYEKTAK